MAAAHPLQHPVGTAVADVVQACLAGGARHVDVAVEFAGAGSWIRVAADGAGPALPPADESLQLAAAADTPAGLDLVRAALAICGKLTVSSGGRTVRWEHEGGAAHRADVATPDGVDDDVVVVMERLQEVLTYKRQEGRVIEAVMARIRGRLHFALGLAFHRVLRGSGRRAPVRITMNAQPVVLRDPFGGGDVTRLRRRELPFVVGERVEAVGATPYVVIPDAADPVPKRQGFFVYVADRLVQAGGWSRLAVHDRKEGLARVAVELPAALDSFGWEAAAHRVLFPASLIPSLRAVAFEAVTGPRAGHPPRNLPDVGCGAGSGQPGRVTT
jgi:hypothetical protein